ncbi:MAG: hypothetical protein R2879_03280 [Saprospiraceae bacterium]
MKRIIAYNMYFGCFIICENYQKLHVQNLRICKQVDFICKPFSFLEDTMHRFEDSTI